MKRLRIIGLTGGIGSGKSTALKSFEQAGIPTLSADTLAHNELTPGHRAYREVLRLYPEVLRRGKIDRAALAKIIFTSRRKRKQLEGWIHPEVARRMREFVRQAKGLVVLDVPLLFETKLESLADVIVCVWCRPEQQIRRALRRGGMTRAEVVRRMNAQWPLERKARCSDAILDNTGTPRQLRSQIALLLKPLEKQNV